MFTIWDRVHPRVWYPMSSLEQSLMDFDELTDRMMRRTRYPFTRSLLSNPFADLDDEEFFKDLPMTSTTSSTEEKEKLKEKHEPQANDHHDRAFSSYSCTASSVVDDKGERVISKRRRYEDSTGRLKAVHERSIGDRVMRTVWNRQKKDEEGEHEQICSSGAPDDFEKLWEETPFGKAAKNKKLEGKEETAKLEAEKEKAGKKNDKMEQ